MCKLDRIFYSLSFAHLHSLHIKHPHAVKCKRGDMDIDRYTVINYIGGILQFKHSLLDEYQRANTE
jgi:hypothetical protein